jgi:uncharacterized protein YndB with AHSA1/START domain
MHGQLIIADISGYTRFLTESELEHANGIIAELLNTIIDSIELPLQVVEVEGDAVFMFALMPEDTMGQTMIEGVERLYTSFASALETMAFNTSCPCDACANISSLGLKIVMHCGEIARSEVGGREKISGPSVILTHRLLKNAIRETTGVDDYLFITDQCVSDLGVEDIVEGWTRHSERYEHVGAVNGHVSSLADVWTRMKEREDTKITEEGAWLSASVDTDAPPWIVWDFIIDPHKRTMWLAAEGNELVGAEAGRIGLDAQYHCAHGNDWNTVSTVIGLRPAEYLTLYWDLANGWAMRYTDHVIPSGSGTKILSYTDVLVDAQSGEPAPQEVLDQMGGPIEDNYAQALGRLANLASEAARES